MNTAGNDLRRFGGLAALSLGVATIVGALGAHALKNRLPLAQLDVLHTAVQYQFLQSLGLLALAIINERVGSAWLRASAWLLVVGTLLFCGSLYLLVAGFAHWIGVVTPLGGLALIVAWLLAGFALLTGR